MKMKFKKEKFYIIIENSEYEDFYKSIKSLTNGYSFIYEGKKWFVHRRVGYRHMWSVTDPYTGCSIARRDTRKNAIQASLDYIYKDQTTIIATILNAGRIDLLNEGIKLPVNRYRWHHG